jgi:hypothetical protein
MNKLILPLLFTAIIFGSSKYNGNSSAPVVLSGAIILVMNQLKNTKEKNVRCAKEVVNI